MSYSDDTSEKMLLNQMKVDRKLRDDLRWDSLKLSWEFYKLLYCESQALKAFIPRRFEDLKLNGGVRLRRIPIKLNYHRSRFKKSKSPRRTLELADSLDRTGLAISQRCVRVKSVGMKKQYHQKKRTAQVKLAQACKSLGMFLDSPSFRDPKDCTKICVDKRQIVDTGMKRETHLFRYGFTFHSPLDIDGHVYTVIGDHSIFAEEVKVLEHDDPDAAIESWQDETSMVSDLKETAKYKSRVETSHVQQQKWKRGFHKVRFKYRRHLRKSLCIGRLVLQKRLSVWSHHKTRKKEIIGLDIPVKPLRQLQHKESNAKVASERLMEPGYGKEEKRSCIVSHSNHVWKPGRISLKLPEPLRSLIGDSIKEMKVIGCSVSRLLNGVKDCEELVHVLELGVWDPGETWLERSQEDGLQQWMKGLKIIKLCLRQRFSSFSSSKLVKKQTLRLVKMFCARQLPEFCWVVQVWEPGGDSDKPVQFIKTVSICHEELIQVRELGVWDPGRVETVKRSLELLKNTIGPRSDDTSDFYVQTQHYANLLTMHSRAQSEEFKLVIRRKTLDFFGVISIRECVEVLVNQPSMRMETWAKESNFGQVECLKGVNSYCEDDDGSQNPNVVGNRVWNPGALEVVEDKAVIPPGSTLKFYGEKIAKFFFGAVKRIIEEAADCHEVKPQDLENLLMTFILASHSPSGVDQNLMRESDRGYKELSHYVKQETAINLWLYCSAETILFPEWNTWDTGQENDSGGYVTDVAGKVCDACLLVFDPGGEECVQGQLVWSDKVKKDSCLSSNTEETLSPWLTSFQDWRREFIRSMEVLRGVLRRASSIISTGHDYKLLPEYQLH